MPDAHEPDGTMEFKEASVQLFESLPKHWRTVKLKRLLAEPLMYGTNEAAELDDPELPRYIRITDFDVSGNLRTDTFRSLAFDKAIGYYLSEGDVLFARSGATVGKSFLFSKYSGEACFAGYLIKARTDCHHLLPSYLYYYTKSPFYEAWKEQIFTQATIQNISATKYAYLPIILPPLKEQHKIAAYLDKACAAIDGAIRAKRQQLEALDDLRKSIIHKALTRGLDEKTRLKNVATINGRSLGNETSPAYTFRYLEISNVNNRGIISEDAISETAFEGAPSRARRVVQDGDTVISSVRPNLQAVAFIQNGGGDLIASTGFYVVSPLRHKLDEKFTYYILLLDGSRQHFEAVAKGVGYPAIDDKDFGTLKFHLPPLAEQRRIAAYLDKKCNDLDDLHRTLEKQISALEKYRKSLIHECVTGKRRIE